MDIDFKKSSDGLVPAIIQDSVTGKVLMPFPSVRMTRERVGAGCPIQAGKRLSSLDSYISTSWVDTNQRNHHECKCRFK